MNAGTSLHGGIAVTDGSTQLTGADMMSADELSNDGSSPDSTFDPSDLIDTGMADEITTQLAAAGPVGVAAAAAINSGGKKKRPHLFETNPAIRKRQQTRLLRKLKNCIEEYTSRVGQQAIVLCCTPSKSNLNSYKVFGSQPLETVMKSSKVKIMHELDQALAEHTPNNTDVTYELPQLALDGIPTPIDKMTQGQLRTFIPEMLKYSTGRSKPGWGKVECRPLWWPNDVPWANVRSDVRTEEQKKQVSWTEALRSIVRNCYKHHGREDMLNIFGDEGSNSEAGSYVGTMVQTINNPDGTVSIIQIDTGASNVVTLPDGSHTFIQAVRAIPEENINQVSSNENSSEMTSMGNNTEPVLGAIQYTQSQHHPTVELPASINISNGHLVMANGETVPINTDQNTGLMTIPVSVYQRLVDSSANNMVEFCQVDQGQVMNQQPQMVSQSQPPDVGDQQQGQTTQLAQHLTQDLDTLHNVNIVSIENMKEEQS